MVWGDKMTFFSYLKTKTRTLAATGVCVALFAAAFALYHLPAAALFYPAALCLLFCAGLLLYDYLRQKRQHEDFWRAFSALTPPNAPLAADSVQAKDYADAIAALYRTLAERDVAATAAFSEMVDYYTVWAHQIKTPLAAMKLSLQNEDSDLSRRLSADLFRTEQYVEMVLAFLRLGADSTDYVLRPCRLDDVLKQSLRKFAPEFIGRKLSLTYEPTAATVVTDEKWFAFLFEQLLGNALKYTREGGISVAVSGNTLTVTDTGIGIAPADLPRVFDKGFTGYNGREDKTASGLGLYLCKRVCDALCIRISLSSEVGVGTTVTLVFDQNQTRLE